MVLNIQASHDCSAKTESTVVYKYDSRFIISWNYPKVFDSVVTFHGNTHTRFWLKRLRGIPNIRDITRGLARCSMLKDSQC